MEAFVGTILPWACSYAPEGWLMCNGGTLQIMQYQALYSIIGVRYGGDARQTFKLPNLQGCFPLGTDQATTGRYIIGQTGGANNVVLQSSQVPLPAHVHTITNTTSVTGGGSGTANVEIKIPVNTDPYPNPMPTPATYVNTPGPNCTLSQAKAGSFTANIYTTNPPTTNANLKPFNATATFNISAPTVNVTSACGQAGSNPGQHLDLLPPFQVVNFIICYDGIYPTRP